MPEYRRGTAAIEEAANRKGGGGFRPFAPEVRWQNDNEKKFVLILTPPNEVGTFDLHEWIPVGKGEKANGETYTRYESFLSRKDPCIGEDYDKISDDLDQPPKTRCMGIAVELEPVVENVKGRLRPTSFTVKTDTYTRNTDDGAVEVTQPEIGLIVQSAYLMWAPLASYDESAQGPLTELPLEVTRQGTDANTRYNFVPFPGLPVDLTAVIEYADGISYLEDDIADVVAAMSAADNDLGAAQAVAEALFNKRLAELADGDRYNELVGPITTLPDRYGKKKAAAKKATPRPKAKTEAVEEATPEPEVKETPRADKFAELKARVEGRS